jgi:hypothetical protein
VALYKQEIIKTTAENAISSFYSEIEELAGEVREVVDNAPEGLAESSRIQTMGEAADTLEECQEPDAPKGLWDAFSTEISVSLQVRGGKKRGSESRAVRCSNAASQAQSAIEAVRGWCDEKEEALQEEQEKAALAVEYVESLESLINEARTYCDEIEEHVGNAEGAEFPGMMG